MVARGYGAGRLTRLPEAPLQRNEQVALLCGVVGLVVAVVLLVGFAPYEIYPIADPIATGIAFALAGLTLLVSVVAAGSLRTRP